MPVIQYVHIGILLLLLGAQLIRRSFLVENARKIFWGAVGITTVLLIYSSQQQFLAWAGASPPARYLLPPYQDISYFLFYIFFRIWAPYLVSGLIAGVILLMARYGNKRFGERFFYPDEPYLIATAFLAIGHPLWIAYLALTMLIYGLGVFIRRLATKQTERVTFYYFWLPIAIAFLASLPLIKTTSLFLLLKL